MRGRSQHDRTTKGVDSWSVAVNGFIIVHPVSEKFFIQVKLITATRKPFIAEIGHNHLGLVI